MSTYNPFPYPCPLSQIPSPEKEMEFEKTVNLNLYNLDKNFHIVGNWFLFIRWHTGIIFNSMLFLPVRKETLVGFVIHLS